jgi:flagellar basal-body rod protein FlgB
MAINDLPVLSALRTKMQWHQERQRVLAENISNSDTPNFKPRDLVEPKFDRNGSSAAGSMGALAMMRTSASHIAVSGGGQTFNTDGKGGFRPGRPATRSTSRTRCSRSPPTKWITRRQPRSTAAAWAC